MQILSSAALLLAAAAAGLAWHLIGKIPKGSARRVLASLLLAAAVLLIAFACWGEYARAGQQAFDEMDGLYPLAAGALGLLLAVAAALTGWIGRRRGSGG